MRFPMSEILSNDLPRSVVGSTEFSATELWAAYWDLYTPDEEVAEFCIVGSKVRFGTSTFPGLTFAVRFFLGVLQDT